MHKSSNIRRGFAVLLAVLMAFTTLVFVSAAANTETLAPGTYIADASLSCYVDAMGGMDFGKNLLTDARVRVDDSGRKTVTLYLTTENMTIYGITVDTYVDADASPIGYYDAAGKLHKDAQYTVNTTSAKVKFVDSITVPYIDDEMLLYLYINSSFIGCQFCDGTGTAKSGHPDTPTKYKGVLKIDPSSLRDAAGEQVNTGSVCAYCNQIHTGFFGKITAFFHNILLHLQKLFHK